MQICERLLSLVSSSVTLLRDMAATIVPAAAAATEIGLAAKWPLPVANLTSRSSAVGDWI